MFQEEELTTGNILLPDEIENLFVDDSTQETPPEQKEDKENKENKEETTEIDVDNLFQSESVGSEEEHQEEREDTQGTGSSPVYSSIATALKDEGIFPDLDDEEIKNIKDADDFRELWNKQIKAELDERQKRVDEALDLGIEPSAIKRFEGTINFLNSITEEQLSAEDDKAEKLRKDLIMQDYINRGYSQARAEREFNKSVQAGTDIEDAKEALLGNKEHFQSQYQKLIDDAKEEEKKELKRQEEQAKKLKTSIFEDKELFGEINVDKNTRKKIFDNISKPVYKDPETGDVLTAIQKYERENPTEFLKIVGTLYTLSNGFTNYDGLIKTKVRREVKKGFKELERTINNTARNADGSLNFMSGVNDGESSFSGWVIDV